MRKLGILVAIGGLLLAAFPAVAQDDGGRISRVVFFSAKEGMQEQMLEGLKDHMGWHREQNDEWTWMVWEYLAGEETGTYAGGTFGHKWEDFDTSPVSEEADIAHAAKTVVPYATVDSVRYYEFLADTSNPSPEPAPMSAILVFNLHPGGAPDFSYTIGKFHEAAQKTEWPVHYAWHRLAWGGEGPQFVLVLPRANWAAFNPPEKEFFPMLVEAFGQSEAEALVQQFGELVRSESSSIGKARFDLSYIPGDN